MAAELNVRTDRLAWALLAACVATTGTGVAFLARVPAEVLRSENDSFLLTVIFAMILLVFGAVGAVVASRIPANPVGWLFLALGLVEGLYEVAYGYTHYSLAVDALPATAYTAWFANWSSPTSPALIGLAFLLFPDGRLLSRRWRPASWLCVLAIVPVVAHYALLPGPINEFPSVQNPLGVAGADFLRDFNPDLAVFSILCCAAVGVFVRFRRSRGIERQQVKWFAWSAGLVAGFILLVALLGAVVGIDDDSPGAMAAGFVFAVILGGLPVSAGVAILRYRLYDIDLVIKRTLVYGSLTILLGASYLALVLLFRLALSPLTGHSDLAVAGSTLAVAALFRPLRSRIQQGVDRRFYRARYDALRTLDSFSARLRDELDLEALGADLRTVVLDTMQPAHVTVWLRGAP